MFSSQRGNNTVETESLTTSSVICLDYTEGKKQTRLSAKRLFTI